MAEDLETLKNDVWVRLPQLTEKELATMCSGLNLTVPEAKQSTKSVLYTLILQQLMSVEAEGLDDQAAKDLFLNIKGSIDQIFKSGRSNLNRKIERGVLMSMMLVIVVEEMGLQGVLIYLLWCPAVWRTSVPTQVMMG